MKLTVWLTEGAERDTDEIYRYIAENDGPEQAERVLAAIERACLALARFPMRGNVPKELRSLGITGFRETKLKPYRIIYRLFEGRVLVNCVLHGSRDIRGHLLRRLVR